MEHPSGMPREPGAHFGMFVGGVIVEDRVDQVAGRDRIGPCIGAPSPSGIHPFPKPDRSELTGDSCGHQGQRVGWIVIG
jgi:hypothetical protein